MEAYKPVVYVLSDSLGETAELVVRAAASQFDAGAVELRKFGYVLTCEAADRVIDEATRCEGVLVYTLVIPELREHVSRRAREAGLVAVDIMGPMLEALSRVMRVQPKLKPGLVHRMDEQYFRRVEAVEFAVKCDDGKDLRSLPLADVVLVGVSRTSKTPLSLYLAQRTYKVANVPLVPEIEPPAELFALPREKVIGLTLAPERLSKVRRERLKSLGLDENSTYADLGRIMEEVAFAEEVFKKLGCAVIDVTEKAVEEAAATVIHIIEGVRRKDVS
ncbi:MAG TPA: kinase/pyrophosphorylase [Firmicutes bacterium]|nr:kinase/pyrophosphorylase [Candidatus Fermentithermobacillaceae bacterium]